MSYVISRSQSGQRNLTHPADGPVTVLAGVTIGGQGTYGIAAYDGAWSLRNFGTVTGQTAGIVLSQGGTVANGAVTHPDARVMGATYGILVRGGPGSVFNAGTIGNAMSQASSASSTGVALMEGGTVTNGSLQLLDARIGNYNTFYGISIAGGPGVVTNFGTVCAYNEYGSNGYAYPYGVAVQLDMGGTVQNGSVADLTATLAAAGGTGVSIADGAGTVTNFGTIVGFNVFYANSAYFTEGVAISLSAGGSVRNGSASDTTALLKSGYDTVQIDGSAGTVTNYGTILSFGYSSDPNTTLRFGYGVYLGQGGVITNARAGLITSLDDAVVVKGANGTVINAGTISVAELGNVGIYMLSARSTVLNTGSIDTIQFDAYGSNGVDVATLYNSGTIDRVDFATANARLVVAPGAVFTRGVYASGQITDILELAKGASSGTLDDLGSRYVGFGKIDVDRGAHWAMSGTNLASNLVVRAQPQADLSVIGTLAIDRRLTLRGDGTFGIGSPGQGTAAGRVVVGQGAGAAGAFTVEAATAAAAAGTIIGAGLIAAPVVDDGLVEANVGTLVVQGTLSGSGTAEIGQHAVLWAKQDLDVARVAFLGSGYGTLELSEAGATTSLISGFGPSDRIDLAGAMATGLSYASATHVLTVDGANGVIAMLHFAGGHPSDAFTFASDGHEGTLIMLR